MRRIHVVVAEQSSIIRLGCVAVLKRMGLNVTIAEIATPTSFLPFLIKCVPDILIVNPLFVKEEELKELKKKLHTNSLRVMALQTQLLPNLEKVLYDASFSLYDDLEVIKEKFLSLIHMEEENDNEKQELSVREKEVVVCIVKGLTNKQIADALCVSIHTVMTHRRNITSKLQIHSPSGLTIYAIVNKLVDINEIKKEF